MRFSALNPLFVADKRELPTADGAGGGRYTCPCGEHGVVIPFSNPLNGSKLSGYGGGWERAGSTVEDLTLAPSIRTVGGPAPHAECAHYFIRNGDVVFA